MAGGGGGRGGQRRRRRGGGGGGGGRPSIWLDNVGVLLRAHEGGDRDGDVSAGSGATGAKTKRHGRRDSVGGHGAIKGVDLLLSVMCQRQAGMALAADQVLVHVCVCVCMSACIRGGRPGLGLYIYTFICIYIHMYMSIYTCICTCI